MRISGGVILRESFGGDFHQGNQESRTQPAIETDAFLIQAIDIGREFSARADSGSFWEIPIAANGDSAQWRVQQMGNDLLDPPLRGDGLLFPIFGSEGTKQFEQHGIELRKKMGGENRLHAPI